MVCSSSVRWCHDYVYAFLPFFLGLHQTADNYNSLIAEDSYSFFLPSCFQSFRSSAPFFHRSSWFNSISSLLGFHLLHCIKFHTNKLSLCVFLCLSLSPSRCLCLSLSVSASLFFAVSLLCVSLLPLPDTQTERQREIDRQKNMMNILTGRQGD